MLTRRLLSRSYRPSKVCRTFTTSAVHHRIPSLADITPNNAPTFDARQKKFREEVREAQRAKREQDSQSFTASESFSSAPTAQNTSNAGSSNDRPNQSALGSLSTANPEAERESATKAEGEKRSGRLSSLIYGTKEGRQMDRDIEKSFSQVLARGKYVHSIVFHQVKPDKVDEYVELVGGWYPRVAGTEDNHVNLVGSWRTEVGDCDTFGDHHSRKLSYQHTDRFWQYTFGNINDTKATMRLYTQLLLIPNFPISIRSSDT